MPWRDNAGEVTGGSYQSWIDRQIAAAEARGEFDDLPGAGKPLPHLGNPDDPDWWIKRLIEREQLEMSVALPPQLALRKQAHDLPERMLSERSERAVRELVDEFNARVRDCWRQPLEGPPVVVRTLDPEALVTRWRTHRTAPTASARSREQAAEALPPPLGRRALGRLLRAFGWVRPVRGKV